jgi:hypothetical protein
VKAGAPAPGLAGLLIGTLLLATACSLPQPSDDDAGSTPSPTSTQDPSGATTSPEADPSLQAAPAPAPERLACYRLDFDQALEAVTRVRASSCERPHTSRTYAVGRVGELVDGQVGAVDSKPVQDAVAATCPRRLATFLGGPEQALRLSMFRPVWFTPSLAQADRGADWFRCDVIALASEGSLATLEGRLEGILGRGTSWKATYGLCATAQPGTEGFERVACGSPHTWTALSTVPIEPGKGGRYPGVDVVRDLGTTPCTDAARLVAEDTLDFQWGYEWPTLEQWRQGRRYGVCWAPAD